MDNNDNKAVNKMTLVYIGYGLLCLLTLVSVIFCLYWNHLFIPIYIICGLVVLGFLWLIRMIETKKFED